MNTKQKRAEVRKLLANAERLANQSATENLKLINQLIDAAYETAGKRTDETEVIRDEIHDFGNKVMHIMYAQLGVN